MTSAIESLPPELMDEMTSHLRTLDKARLLLCNSKFRRHLEPGLFGSEDARSEIMALACAHGEPGLIRLAKSHGASVSTVKLAIKQHGQTPASTNVLTLHLAAKHGQDETFRVLLELGARVDDEQQQQVGWRQFRALVRRLCSPLKPSLWEPFLETIQSSQIRPRQLDLILMSLIKSDAPPHLVRRALDCGANPNSSRGYEKHTFVCPLSMAVLQNSPPLFELLVERGADVHGINIRYPSQTAPLHLPVFAAAYALPEHGPAMMEMCLGAGLDINCRAPVKAPPKHNGQIYHVTPLKVFLRSLRRRTTAGSGDGYNPVDGLQFLFDNGASLDSLPEDSQQAEPWPAIRQVDSPTSIDVLLGQKGGLENLADPQFLSVAQVLAQHGAFRQDTGKMLAKYDYPISSSSSSRRQKGQHSKAVLDAWQDLLATILLASPPAEQPLDALLQSYVAARPRSRAPLGDVTRLTIDRMLSAGADINALTGGGRAPLHELCRSCAEPGPEEEEEPRRRDQALRSGDRWRLAKLLLSRGADPGLRDARGRTAVDLLVERGGRCAQGRGEVLADGLVALLRGPTTSECGGVGVLRRLGGMASLLLSGGKY